ncbi:serine/threonine-protein kinase [Streptomyces caatingaensis]|uniref:serine/threonine-protein kinase n=1 Tax=Streptomyces caatingaensis TaxID=1678637 RepID=UPI00069F3FF2|nr:serine/threonine-protein kinase [Streptomyces caatingaensis]
MSGIRVMPLGDDDPKRLGGYRLLWRLATGGMGRIHLARAAVGEPLVAVKTLLTEGVVSAVDRKRFAREVDLARRVDSAYTARVLDADPRAERPWMAIEYVPAPSLGDLVQGAGPLPPAALSWVAAGTVQALMALHEKDVVHRDIKPQNILLPLSGPLVIDFGISHAADRTTTSVTLGTIDYMSPEQAHGRSSTRASDVFSLGATLFHLAVGRPPYAEGAEGQLQRLARVQAGRLDLAGLPDELAPLIRPCLAREPGRRPELADLLVGFLEKADRTASWSAERWLPSGWTTLISAYEAHGRALDADPDAAAAMTDATTRPVPPPPPTALDTHERDARRERERQAREARERREQELRELMAAAVRARAREEERRRREEDEKRREETGRKRQQAYGGWAAALLVAVLVIALVNWQPWRKKDEEEAGPAVYPTVTAPSSPSPSRTPLVPTARTDVDTGGDKGGDRGTGTSAGTGGSDSVLTPRRSQSPASDPTEDAFRAVSAGDCLAVYDTGAGGRSAYRWSTRVPRKVSCGGQWAGLVRVTSTGAGGDSCPTAMGQASWTYASSVTGRTTRLCLTRVYLKDYCLLGERSGDSVAIGAMTAVDCRAQRVPVPYNQVMHLSGVYRAPPPGTPVNCRQSSSDRRTYWTWRVDDDATLLCVTVFQGS